MQKLCQEMSGISIMETVWEACFSCFIYFFRHICYSTRIKLQFVFFDGLCIRRSVQSIASLPAINRVRPLLHWAVLAVVHAGTALHVSVCMCAVTVCTVHSITVRPTVGTHCSVVKVDPCLVKRYSMKCAVVVLRTCLAFDFGNVRRERCVLL